MPENVPLTTSQVPPPPVGVDDPRHLAGNWADDDPIALDEYFEAANQLPEEYEGVKAPQDVLPVTSRLVRQRYVLTNQFQSVMALPPDARRKHLYLNIFAAVNSSFAAFSGDMFSTGGAADLNINASLVPLPTALVMVTVTLDDYTGPLFIGNYDVNQIFFEIIAVTC